MKAKDSTAPGALEELRGFVNSADLEAPERDLLATAAGATAWLRDHALLGGDDRLGEADLRALFELREALRTELLAHTGEAQTAAARNILSRYAGQADLGLQLGRERDLELVAKGSGLRYVTGCLFAIMYDAIRKGIWPRLKACRKESCQFAFYDHSKNGSGAWCDMAVCGNRVKAQRRRARQIQTSLSTGFF